MTKPDTCSTLLPRGRRTSCGCRAAAAPASSCRRSSATAGIELRSRGAGITTRASVGWWAALVLSATACAPAAPPKPPGVSDAFPEEVAERRPEPEQAPPEAPVPDDVVERAALPFHAVRAADRTPLDQQEFFDELATNDVVCVAEQHDNPHHHWAQLFVIQELALRSKSSGRELGVGFEMFEARFQGPLTRYALGKLGTEELLEQTQY